LSAAESGPKSLPGSAADGRLLPSTHHVQGLRFVDFKPGKQIVAKRHLEMDLLDRMVGGRLGKLSRLGSARGIMFGATGRRPAFRTVVEMLVDLDRLMRLTRYSWPGKGISAAGGAPLVSTWGRIG